MSMSAAAPGPPGSPDRSAALAEFAAAYDFPLDPFQVRACEALERGEGVLVAAPTGAGKTIVGEFAVHLALRLGQKCFYTTPIKALSNQKFADLTARYGPANVGLLTGDNSINGDAPVVVMTTEVLRNMIYAASPALRGLGYVVMDEVHYLSDRFRGAVWEEVIIHLPEQVRLVSLSATVSNTEEFADWLVTVRGHTQVVVEEHRPVPLWQHVLVGDRLHDLFVDRSGQHEPGHSDDEPESRLRVNPELYRLARDEGRFSRTGPRGPKGAAPRRRAVPSRVDVVSTLERGGLLPVITFIFSRAGCQGAVEQFLRSGVRLIKPAERALVREIVETRTQDIPDEDRAVLGYFDWLEGLERGVAAHHAGMLPAFKEVVEELFSRGLVKAVFATETLALGINMPARSVVLEKLVKWNGEAHVDVTPGEYTQLTGRAGRRGIDVEGHGVVLWQPGLDPEAVAGLASTRTYPLRSSFRPSYNMAVNLVRTVGKTRARALLESSFAQFQADRSVVGLARQVSRNQGALDGYAESMTCHLGDFEDYFGYRVAIKDREAQLSREGAALRRSAAAKSLELLRTGDVVRVAGGRRAGLAVVLDAGLKDLGPDGFPRPVVLTQERQVKRLTAADFPDEAVVLDSVKVPRTFNPRNAQSRRDLAASLHRAGTGNEVGTVKDRPHKSRSLAADDQVLSDLRRHMRQHPCHGCADREEHARWAERHERLRRDTVEIERKVSGRTNTIARTFDRVCTVLDRLGYLEDGAVTAAGDQLAKVYSESDLLVVECLRSGLWDRLSPAELAACVSALVYETRRADESIAPRLPTLAVQDTLQQMHRRWTELTDLEDRHRLTFLREPDAGFAFVAHRWASGHRLDEVLTEADLTAGDFVRSMKQLMDLLGQVADVSEPDSPVRGAARAALSGLRRGVVAYSSVS